MNLAEVSVRRPVFATMMSCALVVLGAISYTKLGVDLLPDVEQPTVTIFTTLPGAGPEEIETSVTQVMEEQLNTISGIEEMRSVNREGFSFINLTFNLERKPAEAVQDVRDKIAAVERQLPEGTDPPKISTFDSDASPIMAVALSGPMSLKELTAFADARVKDVIATAPGVGAVTIEGGRRRAMQIELDARRLMAYGLTAADVKRAIQQENVELPGGRVTRGSREDILRTMARVDTVDGFGSLFVARDAATGAAVQLKDVAAVIDGTEEVRSTARLNGQDAVTLVVQKQSGANLIETAAAVQERLKTIEEILPAGCRLLVLRDSAVFVEESTAEARDHLVFGGLLAALAVLLFMGSLRSTLIAAVAIPASLIATFTVMNLLGFTLNNITLLALTLSVGIVIDDAIVVIENIHRHMTERKIGAMQAAMDGTKEIALAVTSTTLSLVVIFLPIAFMSGQIGRFFYSYGVTVAVAVLVSLFIAFTLTPMLGSRFLAGEKQHTTPGFSARLTGWLDARYVRIVAWSLDHRLVIVGLALACVGAIWPLASIVQKDFIPEDDQSEFEISVEFPTGTSFPAADDLMREIEPQIAALPHARDLLVSVGDARGTGAATRGTIYVGLAPIADRELTQQQVMQKARTIFVRYPDIRATVRGLSTINLGGGGNYGGKLKLAIRGPDIAKLEVLLGSLLKEMRADPSIVDVNSPSADRLPEVRVTIDREKAADLGLTARQIAEALRTMVGGEIVSSFRDGDERYDVWLRTATADRDGIPSIQGLPLRAQDGRLVTLENVARMVEAKGPTLILRLNGQRQVFVSANPAPGSSLGDGVDKVKAMLVRLNVPPGYDTTFLGQVTTMEETAKEFLIALILSLLFVYMVLAAQFESFLHPLTILLALPLTAPFALLALVLTGETLNVYSIFGMFMLFGIVKKNGILQVDYTTTLLERGLPLREAILEANRARLRPILMTTMTLIAAMAPMTLGAGPGAASRASLAKVIVGGQALSLFITLLIVPVAYASFHEAQQHLKRRRSPSEGPRPPDASATPGA